MRSRFGNLSREISQSASPVTSIDVENVVVNHDLAARDCVEIKFQPCRCSWLGAKY